MAIPTPYRCVSDMAGSHDTGGTYFAYTQSQAKLDSLLERMAKYKSPVSHMLSPQSDPYSYKYSTH